MAKPPPDVCNKITALLELGTETVKEISVRLGVDYHAVSDLKRALKNKKKDNDVKWAAKAPIELISDMVDKAKVEAPYTVIKKLDKIQEGLSGIQLLDSKFHSTMTLALEKADQLLNSEDLTSGQWVAITNALSRAYSDIFNNKGVSVNVNSQNNFSTDKVNMFKGAMRG